MSTPCHWSAALLLRALPYTKGSWLVHTPLFRLLPERHRLYRLPETGILADLSDPPQLAVVKLRRGVLEPATTAFVRATLREGDVFVDVGANWGYFTCLASRCVGAAGLVVAIEPVRQTFAKLHAAIARNAITNVVTVNAAATDRPRGRVRFVKPWYRQSTAAHEGQGPGEVATTTVDRVLEGLPLEGRRVAVVKVDVEGAELRVLRGAAHTLRFHRPRVVVECSGDLRQLADTMSGFGYRPTGAFDEAAGVLLRYEPGRGGGQFLFEPVRAR